MGSAARVKPRKLAQKLKAIREGFGYSLAQMADQLTDKNVVVTRTAIGNFETGHREPSLIVLLRYARLANISTDVLIDDKLDLPK